MKRALLLSALLSPLVLAQEPAPQAPPAPAPKAGEIADKQHAVGERLARIEETMQRIMKQLAKRNPDQAARLKMAWQRSKDDQNTQRISEIETLLRSEYFQEAFDRQKELEGALQRLLDILLDHDAERKDKQEQIKRLEDIQSRLNQVLEEERDQHLKSEKFADPEKALQRAAAAKAKLSDLIAREQALIDGTKAPAGNASLDEIEKRLLELLKEQLALREKRDAGAQEALAAKAKDLAETLGKFAEGLPDALKQEPEGRRNPADQASGAVARAAEGMGKASEGMRGEGAFAEPQEAAEQDLKEAQDALKRLKKRLEDHGEKKLGQDQQRIRDDAGRLAEELEKLQRGAPGTDSGAGEVRKSQGDMSKAENKLGSNNRPDAIPHEEDAKKELENAYKKLEKFEEDLKRLIQLPDYDKMAEEQQKTEEKTDELLKKMKEEAGKQQGAEGGAPGQQGVEGAKGAMQRAQRNLRGKSANRANKDQKEAIERLEKAQKELEEILRQLREEEQLMLLEALERRFDKMLQQQTRIFKETLSLHLRLKDTPTPPRAVADKGQELGAGEAELSAEAEKVLDILKEEGTTIVIPDVMEDMKRDLDGLAVRLRKLDAGEYTQAVQQDVMETLRELIEVIKEELERKQGGEGGGESPEGDPEEDLLPTSAELKMLKSLQVRVNKRTSTFDKMIKKEDEERGRIAEKQDGVGTLTRTMADKLNRQEGE